MEKIFTLTTIISLAKRYGLIASFLLLAAVLLVGVRLNAESYTWGVYQTDEYHTVYQGINFLVHGEVENFRAQESTRWLVRAFYLPALVYMNTHMGGNVYLDGWSYPGHQYVIKNFIEKIDSENSFSLDPNVRNLFHALRLQYIVVVFVCILVLLLFFFKKHYIGTAFGSLLVLGLNRDLITEQKIFYIEPAIVASLSLFIFAYCYGVYRGHVSTRGIIILGLIAACVISTKLSTIVFLALPIVLFLYLSKPREAVRQTGLYGVSAAIAYLLINFPAFINRESFNHYLHDLTSNFWQYAAGSDAGITVAPGVPQLSLIVTQLEGLFGYALYILPILILFALWRASTQERMLLIPLGVATLLSLYSLSGQHVYLLRNLIPFYIPLVIIALLSVEILARSALATYSWRRVGGALAILAMLWLGGIVLHAGGVSVFRAQLLPSAKLGILEELRAHTSSTPHIGWYSVDVPAQFFRGESFEKRLTAVSGVPLDLNSSTYAALDSQFASLPKESLVVVNNVANNKHLTNYVLPKYFNQNIQHGRYFVFFNNR